MHGAMLVGVWFTKLGQTLSTFIHPMGGWVDQEGGLGEWVLREGWSELRGSWGKGGVAGRRERQLHNFTYGWMLWDPVGCVILDATNNGVMVQVRVHSKLLLISANNTPAPHNMRKHGTLPFCIDKHSSQFFKLLMKICCCCCTNPEMVGPISCTQHRATLSLSLSSGFPAPMADMVGCFICKIHGIKINSFLPSNLYTTLIEKVQIILLFPLSWP
jgi:hypothetical protein